MTEKSTLGLVGSVEDHGKRAWVAPVLTKLEAGQAEVGTRNLADGNFTSS